MLPKGYRSGELFLLPRAICIFITPYLEHNSHKYELETQSATDLLIFRVLPEVALAGPDPVILWAL